MREGYGEGYNGYEEAYEEPEPYEVKESGLAGPGKVGWPRANGGMFILEEPYTDRIYGSVSDPLRSSSTRRRRRSERQPRKAAQGGPHHRRGLHTPLSYGPVYGPMYGSVSDRVVSGGLERHHG